MLLKPIGAPGARCTVPVQDYENWELLIVGDNCPELDDFMQANVEPILGELRGKFSD